MTLKSKRLIVSLSTLALAIGGVAAWGARASSANTRAAINGLTWRQVAQADRGSNSTVNPAVNHVTGDYVEARTASVFAGACHYNGELVTTGRQAIMAWNFAAGRFNGVDLAGVCAMAAVNADDNLGQPDAHRTCQIVIDPSASDAQASAAVSFIQAHCAASIGRIVGVTRSSVSFSDRAHAYNVSAPGFAELAVQPMPNDQCCKQPNLVWYSPLMTLDHRKVGYTQSAAYEAGTMGDRWRRGDENSAFYGTFSF